MLATLGFCGTDCKDDMLDSIIDVKKAIFTPIVPEPLRDTPTEKEDI